MKTKQKSPDALTSEQKSFTDFNFIKIHYISQPVKYQYTDYDILEEAKRHPEKIGCIIADAKEGNCSYRLLEKLYDIKADFYGYDV